jgi:hypothetical protein
MDPTESRATKFTVIFAGGRKILTICRSDPSYASVAMS